MTDRSVGTLSAVFGGVLVLTAANARAAEVDLRVLIVAVGDASEDAGRAVAEQLLGDLGVPYDVLDASQEDLTPARLVNGTRGRYNGVVLTDAETFLASGSTGFDASEFATLHAYERDFGVREAILSGYPSTDLALGVDYGMGEVRIGDDLQTSWQGRAGGTEVFEYVNARNPFPTQGFAFAGSPRSDGTGPIVEPLLVDADDPDFALISVLHYADGREVLLSGLSQAPFFLHTSVLAYEFLNFATSGLFIGARHAFLSVHNDDLFLADEVWNPATNTNFIESQISYRLLPTELAVAANAQRQLRAAHPLAAELTLELAFNGIGADPAGDPLTQAIVDYASEFGFINHTFEAFQMDWLCPDPDEEGVCTRTDYLSAFNEIEQNARIWRALGLPDAEHALTALLTDSHSGLSDRLGTVETSDDIPFPEGFNPALGFAAEDLGVRVLASDASAPNQDRIQRIEGHELVLLPRYPTSMFYNTTNPEELVSEYNYIFHGRYLEQGLNPCSVPEAICIPRDYPEILAADAEAALRHLLAYRPFPHYFHQSNLHVYDNQGNMLQFDWLSRVLTEYERLMDLPIRSPRFHELADIAWREVLAREAAPQGWLDTATGIVTLSAQTEASIEVTGLSGGEEYGGQSIAAIDVSTVPGVFAVDLARDR